MTRCTNKSCYLRFTCALSATQLPAGYPQMIVEYAPWRDYCGKWHCDHYHERLSTPPPHEQPAKGSVGPDGEIEATEGVETGGAKDGL